MEIAGIGQYVSLRDTEENRARSAFALHDRSPSPGSLRSPPSPSGESPPAPASSFGWRMPGRKMESSAASRAHSRLRVNDDRAAHAPLGAGHAASGIENRRRIHGLSGSFRDAV